MASILFCCIRARARSRRCSRSSRVIGTASERRLLRAAMAGGRSSDLCDCASVSAGVAAAAAAEVRRKRRRLIMNVLIVAALNAR